MKKLLIILLVCTFALTGLTVSAARPPKKGGPSLPAPTNLDATAVSSSGIDLTWQDNSDNEIGFKIERGLDGQSFSQVDTVGANVTSYEDTGLNEETTYYYRVRAYRRKNRRQIIHSAYSNTANTTTQGTAPTAPENLTTAFHASSTPFVQLYWSDMSNNEDEYEIERGTNGVDFFFLQSEPYNSSSAVDYNIASSTTYYYRVRATNEWGNSGYSNTAYVVIP